MTPEEIRPFLPLIIIFFSIFASMVFLITWQERRRRKRLEKAIDPNNAEVVEFLKTDNVLKGSFNKKGAVLFFISEFEWVYLLKKDGKIKITTPPNFPTKKWTNVKFIEKIDVNDLPRIS